MLILRNMCCYLSVSRLSVLGRVCVCVFECVHLQDMKYINFYSYLHPFSLILSLSLFPDSIYFFHFRYFVVGWHDVICRCIHACAVCSFSHSSSLDRHFCSFVCIAHMHLTAQQCTILFSPKLNILAWMPDDWRAADGPFIEQYKKRRRKNRTQDSILVCMCWCSRTIHIHVRSHQHQHLHWPRRTMTCISFSYIESTSIEHHHVHILIWSWIDFYYIL